MQLTINGARIDVAATDDTPLLWVLRDRLGMTGTKFGCGMALCGACTVHVDGVATRACITPISVLAGKKIVTIEGLGSKGLSAVQKAWVEKSVPQCGYCQSGMIMAATALLEKTPQPTDAQIDSAMTNLCRCGTYARVRDAIHSAAKEKA